MLRSPCYTATLSLFILTACHDATTEPGVAPTDLTPTAAVSSNTWRQRARMPSDRRLVTTATVGTSGGGSLLFAIGGQSVNATQFCSGGLSKVQAYDGNANTWSTKAPLPLPLMASLAGTIDGRIYVAGGCSSTVRPRDEVWQYDLATNRWTTKTPAPLSLPSPVGAVHAGKLWVFDQCASSEQCFWDSSQTGLERFTFFGFYDPATDRWTRRPLPREGVWPIEAASFNGRLYFLDAGGRVHIYNPATGAWTTGARRNEREIVQVTTAVVGGKWYVVGRQRTSSGGAGAGFLSVYNPAANTWAKRAAPPADYLTDAANGPTAGRVFAGGAARLDLVGGPRPDNHWQYTP